MNHAGCIKEMIARMEMSFFYGRRLVDDRLMQIVLFDNVSDNIPR